MSNLFAAVVVVVLVVWTMGGCAAAMSVAQLNRNDMACVTDNTTKAGADVCRAQVHEIFCEQNPGEGAICADAGSKADGK